MTGWGSAGEFKSAFSKGWTKVLEYFNIVIIHYANNQVQDSNQVSLNWINKSFTARIFMRLNQSDGLQKERLWNWEKKLSHLKSVL